MEGTAHFGDTVGVYDGADGEDTAGWRQKYGVGRQTDFSNPVVEDGCAEGCVVGESAWQQFRDREGKVYFHNPGTGETSWAVEGLGMKKWNRHQDHETGEFYYSSTAGGTKWSRPSSFATDLSPTSEPDEPKWTRHLDPATNKHYYANNDSNETTWSRPSSYCTSFCNPTPVSGVEGILPNSSTISDLALDDDEEALDLSALEEPLSVLSGPVIDLTDDVHPAYAPAASAPTASAPSISVDSDEADFLNDLSTATTLDLDPSPDHFLDLDDPTPIFPVPKADPITLDTLELDPPAPTDAVPEELRRPAPEETRGRPRRDTMTAAAPFITSLLASSKRSMSLTPYDAEGLRGFPSYHAKRADKRRRRDEAAAPSTPLVQLPMTCCAKKLGGRLNMEWVKKWLTLTEAGLSFAEDATGSSNRKIVPLESIVAAQAVPTRVHQKAAVFEITVTGQKDKIFDAESEAVRDRWVAAINNVRERVSAEVFSPSQLGTTWNDMPGEYMFKPKSELAKGASLARGVKSFFSEKWPARWVWTKSGKLMYSKKMDDPPLKEVMLTSVRYCGIVENKTIKELSAPSHLVGRAFEIETDDRTIIFAAETTASRDKWIAYLNDAVYSTSSVIAVTKNTSPSGWMSEDWSFDRWGQWEEEAFAVWEDEKPDAELETDMVDMPFEGDGWPVYPAWLHRPSEPQETYLVTTRKDSKGLLGLDLDPTSLRVKGFMDCSAKDQIKLGSRVVSVNNRHVSFGKNFRETLSQIKEAGVLLELRPPALGIEKFESKAYETVISVPVVRNMLAPDPLVECMDFTPQEMREKRKIARDKRKDARKKTHEEKQCMRTQTLKDTSEIHSKVGAGVSYAAYAVHASTKEVLSDAKKKASEKLTGALYSRMKERVKEHFPEWPVEDLICNYKCLMRFEPSGGRREVLEARDLDTHFLLTSTGILYYSGGRSKETFRGWLPLADVVSIQFGQLVIDEDTRRSTWKTIDWVEHDVSGSDCLQVFTKRNHRYDFFKIRAISLEKMKKIEGSTAIRDLYSYLDICWRECVEVPDPGYPYAAPDEARVPLPHRMHTTPAAVGRANWAQCRKSLASPQLLL